LLYLNMHGSFQLKKSSTHVMKKTLVYQQILLMLKETQQILISYNKNID